MTREEAKKRLEVWLICANCPEDKMCYDSHLHSICEYTDYCDEVPIEEAVKVAIEALEQEPCDKCVYSTNEGCQYDDITETIPPFEDCVSKQAVAEVLLKYAHDEVGKAFAEFLVSQINELPPVNPQKPICPSAGVDCEDCPAYEPKVLNKWIGAEVLDRIRNEMHATAEKHEDGVYYLRDEWVDEIIDKYAEGSDKE